ncbi:AAA family ATPase [Pseudomonas taiwanensis]|uniref:AAA family ATPase n=1 Tax=Pseudomonas taiwanensis TaxID=470150 RepID=UPI0028DDE414|nr:AAA family ATPase [Pseudomonas taiwanensis]MDT8925404.1 AAA family ATPase [Pseudomonas taiwanensis]
MSDPIESSEKASPSSSAEGVQAQDHPQCQPERQAQTFTMAPEVCIDSIAELQKLLTSNGIDPSANYKISINGHTETYPGTASELPFLLLPLWPAGAEAVEENGVFFTLAKLDKAQLLLKLKTEIINHSSLCSLSVLRQKDQSLHLPYGTFPGQFDPAKITGRVNPVVRSLVHSHYERISDDPSARFKATIDANLNVVGQLRLEGIWEGLKTLIDKYPELNDIPQFSELKPQVDVLQSIFATNVLPELMLNQEVKKLLGVSLLSSSFELSGECLELLAVLFYIFIARYPLIEKMMASITAIEINVIPKAELIAQLDMNEGLESALCLMRTGVAPDSASAPFDPYEKVKLKEVEEYFWEDIGNDLFDRDSYTLHGKSVSLSGLEKLQELALKHPHFAAVIDHLLPFAKASFMQSSAFRIPPLLVAGPPGIGKSKFFSDLCDVIDMGRNIFHASQYTCGSQLVGLTQGWRTAHPGDVANAMLKTRQTNPLIVFDELDRVPPKVYGNGISPEVSLMRLLEPSEAKNFVDAYQNEPHDVSNVNWIFTCNQPRQIPYALLTRLQVIYVYPPREEAQIDAVHQSIWKSLIDSYQIDDLIYEQIDPEVLVALREAYYEDLQFRKTRRLLERALNNVICTCKPGHKTYLTLEVLLGKSSGTRTPIKRLLN